MDRKDWIEVIRRLEPIVSNQLKYTRVVDHLAELAQKHDIKDLSELSKIVQSTLDTQLSKRFQSVDMPATIITIDYLLSIINSWIRNIRMTIFSQEEAPFNSLKEAHNWLQYEYENSWQIWKDKGQVEELPKEPLILTYFDEDGELSHVYAAPNSNVQLLVRQSIEIAQFTRFESGSVAIYILTGITPVLPPYALTFSSDRKELATVEGRKQYSRPVIDVRFNISPTRELMLSLYESIREWLGTKKNKTFTEKHLALYHLVKSNAEPPKGEGTIAYWESIQYQWNNAYPDNAYKTWKGMEIAYKRITKKLSDQFR